jgi:hypothetical protein
MKTLIWALFLILALLWTGLAVTSIGVSDWLLSVLNSGLNASLSSGSALSEQVAAVSLPAWLQMWVGPEWLEAVGSMMSPIIGMLSVVLPSTDTLGTLITVLVWVVWGFGAALLLVCALGANWFTRRRSGKALQT